MNTVGLALLAAYLGQAVAHLDLPWLTRMQAHDSFKLATGCVLVVYLWLQWFLATRRRVHTALGALAPAVLYLHTTRFAFGYLAWLVTVYLGVAAVGLLHRPIVAHRARALFTAWSITHLALSVLLIVLAAYHVVIAIAYE
jgi:hypothetical protein